MVSQALAAPHAGERFELRGQLGSGGMGVVYRVHDRVRGREVALKTLKSPGGRELYRFKREFRALADLAHPNLATLHELYTVGDEWMFTMELVDGVPFNQWVRPATAGMFEAIDPFSAEVTGPSQQMARGSGPIVLGALDEPRLRAGLHQLADGVAALHAAGKLHRDLKPTNVLVDRDGRVVILDFGLIADVDSFHVDRTHERAAVGTPSYMSPEQAADRPLTDASDWYSVGVMLYEALTGRRPFEGSADQMLLRKQKEDPPRPSAVTAVPADLDALCMALLDRDPMHRPDGQAVQAALGRVHSPATLRIAAQTARGPFVGRGDELTALRRAFVDSRQRGVTTLVIGRSGIGKSSLVRAFLDEASVDGEAVILEGRCYEREAVPYKALDQVVDGLTAYLMRLPRHDVDRLVPRDVAALVRLFPVMRRVPGMAAPVLPGALPGDPVELRRRAFGALRELLAEIAEARSVVIAIDDLQWGDIDGAWALSELIRGAGAPRMLVIASHRREDVEHGEVLETLRKWSGGELREIEVGAMLDDDARRLWSALGGPADDAAVGDAAGSPLLLAEIVRAQATGGARVTSVDDAVLDRMSRLDGDARALLHAVAVAVRPLGEEMMTLAVGLRDATAALASLRMDRLVRVRGGSEPIVEPYHDRVREAVSAAMSNEERRAAHAGIARALATEETHDRELMIEHWLGAGDGERASRYAERAGRQAEERFAFHRAAEFYALALMHGDLDAPERCAITARRAQTLCAAGRLVEAAVEFRSAASLTRGREKFMFERRSVEQLLRAGHLDRGLAAADALLTEVGVKMPRTWRRTVLALMIERAKLRLRGYDFVERPDSEVDPVRAVRLEVLWSVSSGFAFVNPVVGRVLQARLLREALDAGELRRVVLAYGLEFGYLAVPGIKSRDLTESLLAKARGLAARDGQPELAGFIEASAGVASYLWGRFREAHDRVHAGELAMRQNPAEMGWQLDLCEIFRCAILWSLGELREMLRIQPEYLRAAEERGNVYGQRGLRGWRSNVVWLIKDDPIEARVQAVKSTATRGAKEAFHLHHYYDIVCNSMIDLYEKKGDAAHARFVDAWDEIAGSHLLRIQQIDAESHWLRGAAAIAAARHDLDRLRVADQCVRRLDKISSPYSRVLACQLRAAADLRRGQREDAIEALRATIATAEVSEMAAHAAAARMRLGMLLGGAEGKLLTETADRWMRDQGVVAPIAFANMLSPGLSDIA